MNETHPLSIKFDFQKRKISVLVQMVPGDGRPKVKVLSSSGSQEGPPIVTFSSYEANIGTTDTNVVPNANNLDFTVKGTIQSNFGSVTQELADVVWLDTTYPQVQPGSWVVLERS